MLKRTCNEEEEEEQNATTVHSERERETEIIMCVTNILLNLIYIYFLETYQYYFLLLKYIARLCSITHTNIACIQGIKNVATYHILHAK